MCSGSVLVSPRMWPETTDTAPNSPMARAPHSSTPYSSAHLMLGRVTRRNTCHAPAPSERAASSSSAPCCSINGISSRATKGKVMNKVASTIAGGANNTCTSCRNRMSANHPSRPNSNTRHRPATTGETAKGKSISASSARLPRNSKRVTAHAVAIPKNALSGITIAAVISVSFNAARASGSASAANHTWTPSRNAAPSTIASGITSRNAITSIAIAMRLQRNQRGGCSGSSMPALPREQGRDEGIDRQQAQERGGEQQRGDRDGAVVVVLLQADGDQQRRDLGLERQVSGDEDHRPVLAHRACEGQREAGQHRGRKFRQYHAAQRGEAIRAQRRGGLFLVAAERFEHGLHRAHRERQADEHQRDHDAGCRVGDLDAPRFEEAPHPAVLRVDR